MSPLLRLLVCLTGVMLIALVIRSVVIREMTEKQSLFWIFSGLVVIVFGLFPPLSFFIADIFGVEYAPSIIFAFATVIALYGIFNCYQSIAGLHKRVQELAMHVSLLNQENSVLLAALQNMNRQVPEEPKANIDTEKTAE